jgi:quercetin dioxygenase-like cupin family protein
MADQIFYNLKSMLKPLAAGIQWAVVKGTHMTIVYYEFKAGAVLPMAPHKHEHAQFSLPVEGLIEQTVGSETKVVGPGDLVYIAPNTVHSGRMIGYDCKMIDVFTPNREDHLQNYLLGKRP